MIPAAKKVYDLVEQHAKWGVAAFSAVYFAAMLRTAQQKPLWADEIGTHYFARLPHTSDILQALGRGLDVIPPLFHVSTHVLAANGNPILLRLPAILGVWCAAMCLYLFVSRRLSRVHGFTAMLMLFATMGGKYACEARPYGIALGGAAGALVCWQAAVAGRRRRLALAGLWLCCALAVAIHYYAVLILMPLALGEAVRWWENRKPDLWMATILGSSVLPLLPALPFIRAARATGSTFWGHVRLPGTLTETYNLLLEPALVPLPGLFVAALIAVMLFRDSVAEPAEGERSRALLPEMAAIAGFAALPAAGVCVGMYLGGFAPRYVIFSVLGFCAGFAYMLVGRRELAVLCLFVLAVTGVGPMVLGVAKAPPPHKTVPEAAARNASNLPIVFSGPLEFVETHYYAPGELADRLFYLPNRPIALRRTGTDAVDLSVMALAEISSCHAEDYYSFTAKHPQFLVVTRNGEEYAWLLPQLVEDKAQIVLRNISGKESVYEIAMK